jgi:tetratricopeptide (TPR) repeat protein
VAATTKYHLGYPLFYTGQIERAVELNREVAKQLSGPAALERHGLSGVPSVLTRGFLAWALSELGEFEEAKKYARQGIELAELVKNVFSTALVYAQSGIAYLRHGDLETAKTILQNANTLCHEAELQSILSFVAGGLGDVYLLLGRPDDALPILEKAVEPQNLESSIGSSIHPITALSEAYRLSGQIAKAIRTAEEALRLYRQTQEHCFGAWALYVKAKIQSENGSGQIEQATHTFRQAIDLAQELKMRPLLAHCSLELGQFYTRRGEYEKACSELMKAIDLYRSLGMRFWQPKAEALLSKLS